MPAAPSAPSDSAALAFIARWSDVGAAERANYVLSAAILQTIQALPDFPFTANNV